MTAQAFTEFEATPPLVQDRPPEGWRAEVLSIQYDLGRDRVIFRFLNGDRIDGPHVESRPKGEDHEAWVRSRLPVDVPPVSSLLRDALDTHVGDGTFEAVKTALQEAGVVSVVLGASELLVESPGPDDVENRVSSVLDQARGSGTFAAVKAVLRAAGYSSAQLGRKTELVL